ncbi:hypothetical protein PanWU01x14_321020 [Parasponia andersonii]|uniref:Disease resistance N-terminal domain-containing protein n=1 Tax=Parasponia andersonii TaxID=3476 RepID=A0A2P5ALB0_PARAD|nr:hypothetical protein PanWU01x14_321020 [Parasponia andersonii]
MASAQPNWELYLQLKIIYVSLTKHNEVDWESKPFEEIVGLEANLDIMAEIAVGLVVDKLIPLLTEEANLLSGVHKDVDIIRKELQGILAFLKDADRRSELNYGVKLWVKELREAAFQIENVIDEYMHFMAQQKRPHKHIIIGFLHKISFLVVQLKQRHDIASKV